MAGILERNKNLKPKTKTREEHAEDALYREVWEEVNNEKTVRFVKKYSRHIAIGALAIMIVVTGVQIGVHTYRQNKIARTINYETAAANMDTAALASIGRAGHGATSDLALFQAYMLGADVESLEKLAADGATRDLRDLARMHVVALRGDKMTGVEMEKYLDVLNTKKSPNYFSSR